VSRVFKTESSSTERNRLSKGIVLALRELMQQTEPNDLCLDLVSFVSIALDNIYKSIDSSCAAWEKKGYWVKADRFRREWEWSGDKSIGLRKALLAEDWAKIAELAAGIGIKFNKITVSPHHRLGTPWVGAHKIIK
jgi:hypothetical protein